MSAVAATARAGAAVDNSFATAVLQPAQLSTHRKVLALGVMCLGFFIAYLDIQIVAASLQEIGGGLSASQDEIAWVQTSYLIAEIVVIPLSGWLSRVLSTHWLFAASAAGFTLASLLCATATDIQSMIAFRALQGFLGGSMIPTVFTTAFFFFQGQQRVIAAAIVGSLASLAPTLGPVVGGFITDTWSWQWLFYINVVPGFLVAILVPVLVRIDKPDLALLRGADYLGIVLLALFLGCLEYVLEEGPRWDWFGDETIAACAWISGIAGVGFIVRSLQPASCRSARARHPQFLARLLVLLRDRCRHFRHGLSHSTVPRSRARARCMADRHGATFSRRFPTPGSPNLQSGRQPHRPAMANDVRARLLRHRHVVVHTAHP